jgi:hypothetical protein
LSGIAGFEGAGLEFYDDIAPELEMVEKEVEVEILVANLEMHLPTDKGETGSQLQKELLDVVDEGLLDLGLAAGICGAKKVEEVGVFEKLRCHVRVDGGHGEGEVALGATGTEMEAVLDLDFQDASAPSVGDGFPDVKLAVDGIFNALNDLEDMAPRQLRNRLLRNWRIGKLASEYFHCQQVARGEALHVGESLAEIGGEAVDDLGAPSGFLLALKYYFSGVPIGFDDDGIGREHGADARTLQVAFDFFKCGAV